MLQNAGSTDIEHCKYGDMTIPLKYCPTLLLVCALCLQFLLLRMNLALKCLKLHTFELSTNLVALLFFHFFPIYSSHIVNLAVPEESPIIMSCFFFPPGTSTGLSMDNTFT